MTSWNFKNSPNQNLNQVQTQIWENVRQNGAHGTQNLKMAHIVCQVRQIGTQVYDVIKI